MTKNKNQRLQEITASGLNHIMQGCANVVAQYKSENESKSNIDNIVYTNVSQVVAHEMIDPKAAAKTISTTFNDSKNSRNHALRNTVTSATSFIDGYVKANKKNFNFNNIKEDYRNKQKNGNDIDDDYIKRKQVMKVVVTILKGCNEINWTSISSKIVVNSNARQNEKKRTIKTTDKCEAVIGRMAMNKAFKKLNHYLHSSDDNESAV